MNCAPITVTAGKTKRDEGVSLVPRDESYAELFVGNLADINSCKSTSSTDPEYPFPGPIIEKLLTGASPSFASISGTSCVAKGQTEGLGSLPTATAGNAGGSAAGTTAGASATASSAAGQQSSSPAAGSPSGGGVFATTGGGGAAASPTTLVTATSPPRASSVYVSPVTTAPKPSSTSDSDSASMSAPTATDSASAAPPAATDSASSSAPASTSAETSASASATTKPAPSATLSPTGGGSGSGNSTGSDGGSSSSAKSGPCTSEGMFNCIGTKYQQCASGAWTAMQALPGGTTCQQGESENLWARDTTRPARARKLRWSGKRWVAQGA